MPAARSGTPCSPPCSVHTPRPSVLSWLSAGRCSVSGSRLHFDSQRAESPGPAAHAASVPRLATCRLGRFSTIMGWAGGRLRADLGIGAEWRTRGTVLRRGAHVWRRGHVTGRLRESCGEPWRSWGWFEAGGWSLLGRAKGPSAHASSSTAYSIVRRPVCVILPVSLYKSSPGQPRAGQGKWAGVECYGTGITLYLGLPEAQNGISSTYFRTLRDGEFIRFHRFR